jgi:hypothetical protein
MRFIWFNLMPWPYLPDDFREKYRSVWVDAHTRAKAAVLDLQRPGLCETRTLRWRDMDSNFRFPATVNLVVPPLCRAVAWDG